MLLAHLDGGVAHERWSLAKPFAISHTVYEWCDVVVATISDGVNVGRGEAAPTEFYGECVAGVVAEAERLIAALKISGDWSSIHDRAEPGAARNAVDCAIWDLRAKRSGRRAWTLAALPRPKPCDTVLTLGLDTPEAMAAAAASAASRQHRTLKLKVGPTQPIACIAAVRGVAPGQRLVVDPNGSWDIGGLKEYLPALRELGVDLLEQPLPPGSDYALAGVEHLVPIAADESCHIAADLDRCQGLYDVVNIKLDKAGGLTEALRLLAGAKARGFGIMVGCMEGTSLAMAPATLLTPFCQVVDLDGPLLIGSDRPSPLAYRDGKVFPPARALWG